ncbi:MAG: hypothetical protein ACKVYV_02790 [Limisphaerales bacterium]
MIPALMLAATFLLAACRTADGWPDDPPLEAARFEGFSVATVAEAVSRQFTAQGFTAKPQAGEEEELVFDRPWSRGDMFRHGELTADDGALGGPMWLRLRIQFREAGAGVVEARSDSFNLADHGAVLREEQPLAHHRAKEYADLLAGAKRALEAGVAEPRAPR